jgi:hypothetical protein
VRSDDCAHVDAKDFVHLNFRAFIRSAAVDVHKEESRDLKFYFFDEYDYDVRHHDAQSFFKAITLDFAKGEWRLCARTAHTRVQIMSASSSVH